MREVQEAQPQAHRQAAAVSLRCEVQEAHSQAHRQAAAVVGVCLEVEEAQEEVAVLRKPALSVLHKVFPTMVLALAPHHLQASAVSWGWNFLQLHRLQPPHHL